jgi:hypothetical protein
MMNIVTSLIARSILRLIAEPANAADAKRFWDGSHH